MASPLRSSESAFAVDRHGFSKMLLHTFVRIIVPPPLDSFPLCPIFTGISFLGLIGSWHRRPVHDRCKKGQCRVDLKDGGFPEAQLLVERGNGVCSDSFLRRPILDAATEHEKYLELGMPHCSTPCILSVAFFLPVLLRTLRGLSFKGE